MKRKPLAELLNQKNDGKIEREPLEIPELTVDQRKDRIIEVMDRNVSIIGRQDINKRLSEYDENREIEEGQERKVKTNAGALISEEKAKNLKDGPW